MIRGGAVILVALAAGHLVQNMNAEKMAAQEKVPDAIEKVSAGPDAAAAAPAVETAATPRAADTALPLAAALTATTAPAEPAPAATATPSTPADAPTGTAAAPKAMTAAEPEVAAPIPEVTPAALPDSASTVAEPLSPAPAALDPVLAQPQPKTAPLSDNTAELAAPESCTPAISLTAGPQAVITVSITAPCRAGERVVLRHAGLALAEKLSPQGTLVLDVPALQSAGDVSVLFPDAEMLRDTISMPDVAGIHRFAVQWMADDAFQLHAFENGADYGQPGDVWADAPVSPNGGFLISLGDPGLDLPMLAQVYTYPAAVKADVVIESAVTEATCGRELLGEVLESKAGAVTSTELTLAMPECDALGDILVLKNPGQDVTLAAVN